MGEFKLTVIWRLLQCKNIPKPDELHLLCGDLSFHIVCIVET